MINCCILLVRSLDWCNRSLFTDSVIVEIESGTIFPLSRISVCFLNISCSTNTSDSSVLLDFGMKLFIVWIEVCSTCLSVEGMVSKVFSVFDFEISFSTIASDTSSLNDSGMNLSTVWTSGLSS